jgi:thymidylate synthase ThyX
MVLVDLIQDSYSASTDSRISSFQWEYPRFIHGEIMTHRVLGRNAGSSRAMPTFSAIEVATEHMVIPNFARNKAGMQPGGQLSHADNLRAREIWKNAAFSCTEAAKELNELKVHKQWANRMLEWFSPIRIVATATEWDNFLWLRNDTEAQLEFEMLADRVEHALAVSSPDVIPLGHAHTPYVDRKVHATGVDYSVGGLELTMVQAMKVSASVCGQMSYRKADDSVVKADDMYEKFMNGRRVHASPFEHQAICTGKTMGKVPVHLDRGVTHFDRKNNWWSGNLKGWVQFRHLIPNNTCTDLTAARKSENV